MTEQEKNKFCGVLMENYGINLTPQNELLPILYIMYGLSVQMGRTSTKFLESIGSTENKIGNIADKITLDSESFGELIRSLSAYESKITETTNENKRLLDKLSELQTAHIKVVNEQSETVKLLSKIVKDFEAREEIFVNMVNKFGVLLDNKVLQQESVPKRKKGFFGMF